MDQELFCQTYRFYIKTSVKFWSLIGKLFLDTCLYMYNPLSKV